MVKAHSDSVHDRRNSAVGGSPIWTRSAGRPRTVAFLYADGAAGSGDSLMNTETTRISSLPLPQELPAPPEIVAGPGAAPLGNSLGAGAGHDANVGAGAPEQPAQRLRRMVTIVAGRERKLSQCR